MSLPPGPRTARPLQTLAWIARPGPFMRRCRERFGDTFTVRMQNLTLVFLSDPAHVKSVFTGDPRLLRAGEANVVLRPILGSRSILLLDEPEHMVDRRIMLPPFHGERMQAYRELMASVATQEARSWPAGEPIALRPRMQAITLEVIMRAVFGITDRARLAHVSGLLERMLAWTTDMRRFARFAISRPETAEADRAFRGAMDPVDAALLGQIHRARAAPDLEEREDILSLLLRARYEDGAPMSDAALRDELVTLLLAGHETTATSLAWAFERLMRVPGAMERLTAEARDPAGGFQYADAVVKETLRLRPVIPIVVRVLAEPMEIAGHRLAAGSAVAPCIYLMHRREDIYPEAERFRPERFLERDVGTYTWIPFGGGVRRCLGASFAQMEMREVLQAVAREVDLRPSQRRSERVARRAITLVPSRGALAVSQPAAAAAPAVAAA